MTRELLVGLVSCKNQESADKSDFMDFFIFCPEKPFGELLSKITITTIILLALDHGEQTWIFSLY